MKYIPNFPQDEYVDKLNSLSTEDPESVQRFMDTIEGIHELKDDFETEFKDLPGDFRLDFALNDINEENWSNPPLRAKADKLTHVEIENVIEWIYRRV